MHGKVLGQKRGEMQLRGWHCGVAVVADHNRLQGEPLGSEAERVNLECSGHADLP